MITRSRFCLFVRLLRMIKRLVGGQVGEFLVFETRWGGFALRVVGDWRV